MGQDEINAFLTHLAVKEKLGASSQNQALGALLFLYRTVLGGDVGSLEGVVRAHRPRRLPWYSAKMRFAEFSATCRAPLHWCGKFFTAVG
jgi:hypothetical protein